MEQQVRRNIYLDLFKYFLAFLVIAIHSVREPFEGYYRLGVVMFLMITGFFMYSSDDSKQLIKAKRFIKRALVYMLIAFLIHLVYDIYLIIVGELALDRYLAIYTNQKTYLNFFAFQASPRYAHLWYVIALFFVSIFHYLFVKFKITSFYKWYIIIVLILSVYLFYFVYPKLGNDFEYMYPRNAYLMGLPIFAIGFLLNKHKTLFKYPNYLNLILGIIFFILQYYEMQILKKEYYYSSIFSSCFLLLFFTNLKTNKNVEWYYSWIGKNATFYIYVIHLIVIGRLDKFYYISRPVIKPLIVLIISFLIYEVVFLIIKLCKYLINKRKLLNIDS